MIMTIDKKAYQNIENEKGVSILFNEAKKIKENLNLSTYEDCLREFIVMNECNVSKNNENNQKYGYKKMGRGECPYELERYTDSKGFITIGIGFNMSTKGVEIEWNKALPNEGFYNLPDLNKDPNNTNWDTFSNKNKNVKLTFEDVKAGNALISPEK